MKLPLPIPAKSCKKVMEIFKFFKQGTKPTENKKIRKLYAQALSIKTSKILRIKKTFPKLLANKIDNIHKIVNRGNKLKQKINMMTKVLSRKQVIIPMSNNNKAKFMECSNLHITNLNKALNNIKSDILIDFFYINQVGITIVTNKVTSSLNLQTIEKYVKNANHIDFDKVNISYLP